MTYEDFVALAEKPQNKTTPLGGVNSQFALWLDGDNLLECLDDFDSFEDLTDGIGIEDSWSEDFAGVFPNFKPIAVAMVEEPDSYSEFVLLVDTSKDSRPVVWMSAESFDWDEFEESKTGFEDLADSFEEFYASLVDFEE